MHLALILLGAPTAERTTLLTAANAASGVITLIKSGSKPAMLRYVPLVVLVPIYLTIPQQAEAERK
jgi:predicted ATPase